MAEAATKYLERSSFYPGPVYTLSNNIFVLRPRPKGTIDQEVLQGGRSNYATSIATVSGGSGHGTLLVSGGSGHGTAFASCGSSHGTVIATTGIAPLSVGIGEHVYVSSSDFIQTLGFAGSSSGGTVFQKSYSDLFGVQIELDTEPDLEVDYTAIEDLKRVTVSDQIDWHSAISATPTYSELFNTQIELDTED